MSKVSSHRRPYSADKCQKQSKIKDSNCTKIDTKDDKSLQKQYLSYIKMISAGLNEMELQKRHLANRIQGITNYHQIFTLLDTHRKGAILVQTLHSFLMSHKIYCSLSSVERYLQKYSHNDSQYLDENDLIGALLPQNQFTTVSSKIDTIYSAYNQFKTQNLSTDNISCSKNTVKTLSQMVAMVIENEIKFMIRDYDQMEILIQGSLQRGAQLWRLLDVAHVNLVTFETIQAVSDSVGLQIGEKQWSDFLYWHFRTHKKALNRELFMSTVKSFNEMKKANRESQLEQLKLKKQKEKYKVQQEQYKKGMEQIIKEKLATIDRMGIEEFSKQGVFLNTATDLFFKKQVERVAMANGTVRDISKVRGDQKGKEKVVQTEKSIKKSSYNPHEDFQFEYQKKYSNKQANINKSLKFLQSSSNKDFQKSKSSKLQRDKGFALQSSSTKDLMASVGLKHDFSNRTLDTAAQTNFSRSINFSRKNLINDPSLYNSTVKGDLTMDLQQLAKQKTRKALLKKKSPSDVNKRVQRSASTATIIHQLNSTYFNRNKSHQNLIRNSTNLFCGSSTRNLNQDYTFKKSGSKKKDLIKDKSQSKFTVERQLGYSLPNNLIKSSKLLSLKTKMNSS